MPAGHDHRISLLIEADKAALFFLVGIFAVLGGLGALGEVLSEQLGG